MAVDAASLARARPRVVARLHALPAWATLTGLVALSTVVRSTVALTHSTPRYFPDEFLYSQLARSLAAGRGLSVLGEPTRLPALLEPLVTSLAWLPGDAELAYRLTQTVHALAMSLAAVPVCLLARRLGLRGPATGLAVVVAVLSPDLLYAGYATADALGYTLALAAVAAGVAALTAPTARAQTVFLVLVGLASFSRIQYAALLPAFALASLLAEHGSLRRALMRYRIVNATLGIGIAAGLALGSGLLGRYADVTSFQPSRDALAWLPRSAFLLALASGVAIVPGAVAWLVRPARAASEERRAFARLVALLTSLLLVAAALMAVETTSERFFERYLMIAIPLLALAFGCWADEGRPGRRLTLGLAVVLLVAAARLPVSSYTVSLGSSDSPFLLAVRHLQGGLGVDGASLLVALAVTAALVVAVWSAVGRGAASWAAALVTLAALAAVSVGAGLEDRSLSRTVSARTLPAERGWVDGTDARDVLLLQTADSPSAHAMTQAFWNASVTTGALLGDHAEAMDGASDHVQIRPDGELKLAGGPIERPLLVATSGTRPEFTDAKRLAGAPGFVLVAPSAPARLASLAEGLAPDGWLAARSSVTVWPGATRYAAGARLRLSVPAGFETAVLEVQGAGIHRLLRVPPGRSVSLDIPATTPRPWRLELSARRPFLLEGNRSVAAKARLEEISTER